MHAIAFGAKRVFHGFVRYAREQLLPWPGLTAARFDMLSTLIQSDYEGFDCPGHRQNALRRKLGVCASVVSRMVRALEKLGWVARRRDLGDRRTFWIQLTAEGEQVLEDARRLLLSAVAWGVDVSLCLGWDGTRAELPAVLAACNEYLDRLRLGFGDRATLAYPLRPAFDT